MKKKIYSIIHQSAVLSRIFSYFNYYFGRKWKKEFHSCVQSFLEEEKKNDKKYLRQLALDALYCLIYYEIEIEGYFRYELEKLSDYGRRQIVGKRELFDVYHSIDDPESIKKLQSKIETYCLFKKYYNRDVIIVDKKETSEQFAEFCAKHRSFIVKPLDNCGGHGIYRVNLHDGDNIDNLYKSITQDGRRIIEELIIQGEGMAKFHPLSINTVRIVSKNLNGKVKLIQGAVRFGTGDSVVDNGCLSASVDIDRGIITSVARYAHTRGYCCFHPDTDVQIIGAQIPEWEELKEFVRKLCQLLPNQRIIGWDLAYSTNGWTLVEANSHPGIQILSGRGIGAREILEEIVSND